MAKPQSEAKRQKHALKQAAQKASKREEHQRKKRARKHNAERDTVRDAGRDVVNKKIATGIKARFGLPDDCTVFRVPEFGEGEQRVVTFGTIVLVNLAGNKLICVARFNKEVISNCDIVVFTLC